MKKIFLTILALVFIIIFLLFFGIGGKRTDVYLQDYKISEDGKKLEMQVSLASSMGYIRMLKVKQGGDNQYITFYSTFGLNNKFGAKNEFEIEVNPTCEEIYFYRGNGVYELELRKDLDNNWVQEK